MKARFTFAKASFLVICTLLVSFSFVEQFGFQKASTTEYPVPVKILKESADLGNNESLVIVNFFDHNDDLVYHTEVDLKDQKRKSNEKLVKLLAKSDFILKVDNTLYFRIN